MGYKTKLVGPVPQCAPPWLRHCIYVPASLLYFWDFSAQGIVAIKKYFVEPGMSTSKTFHDCRTTGAVDCLTTFFLSFIPFTGLNNFYRRDPFNGFCELMNGIMMIMSIIVLCIYHNPHVRRYNYDASFWAVVIGVVIAFLDLVKVMQMIDDNGSVDKCEIFVIMISIVIVLAHCTQMEYPLFLHSLLLL